MKRFLVYLCMIACIFGLTACGGEEQLTEYEQWKVTNAQQLSSELIIPVLSNDELLASLDGYTAEEVAYLLSEQLSLYVDGNAFRSAQTSFQSARDSIGAVTGTGSATASIDGDQIIVEIEVMGEKKNATAEVILSNDMFLRLESAALNPSASLGELMGKAALNTLIGMGTVFVVLILISGIISCFRFISKAQEGGKKKAQEAKSGVDNAVAQIVEQETVVDEADDLELVAVIAAAVASYQGAASADGFVVRSIRRR